MPAELDASRTLCLARLMTFEAQHISQAIDADPAIVAAFGGDPANLPRWAAGLSAGIRNEDGRWVTDSPMGAVEVRFTDAVGLGILDHDVIFPDGTSVHNPLRVLRNGDGSEVVFTLYRLPGVTGEELDEDAASIAEDLWRLKELLEAAA